MVVVSGGWRRNSNAQLTFMFDVIGHRHLRFNPGWSLTAESFNSIEIKLINSVFIRRSRTRTHEKQAAGGISFRIIIPAFIELERDLFIDNGILPIEFH